MINSLVIREPRESSPERSHHVMLQVPDGGVQMYPLDLNQVPATHRWRWFLCPTAFPSVSLVTGFTASP